MASPATFDALQAAIKAWIDDAAIDASECIGLAEARLNRLLTGPEMDASATVTPIAGAADLPADFVELRAIYLSADLRVRLESAPLGIVQGLQALTGVPSIYCVTGGAIQIAPIPDADYPIVLTYRRTVPPLSSTSPTNWVLARHPDLYLAAALAVAEFKGWNDERLPMLKSWYDELLAEVNTVGTKARRAGPIRLRPPVGEAPQAIRSAITGIGTGAGDFLTDS